ncbi:MAG: alpha/beta hydrolase-fold protein [Propionibacteriaceae bacterium]
MSLTSPTLLVILAVLAGLVPIVVALLWRKLPGGAGGFVLRLVAIVLCQVLAVGAIGLWANNQFGFYNTWGDIIGEPEAGGDADADGGEAPDPDADPGAPLTTINTDDLVPDDGSKGTLTTFPVTVPGEKGSEAVSVEVMAWMPKQYADPANKDTKFPVLMMLPGQPSKPETLFDNFDFSTAATDAIDSGKVAPFVAVFPPLMIAPPRDTECTDIKNGPQAETWLNKTVPDAVQGKLRVDDPGPTWSLFGFSTGAFCAAKLLLRNPDTFGAAVSVGGYYDALTDDTTGDLFKGDKKMENENSPRWLVDQNRDKQTNLMIVVSAKDESSYTPGKPYANSKQMIETCKGVPGVTSIVVPSGGHHYDTYINTVPETLEWLNKVAKL